LIRGAAGPANRSRADRALIRIKCTDDPALRRRRSDPRCADMPDGMQACFLRLGKERHRSPRMNLAAPQSLRLSNLVFRSMVACWQSVPRSALMFAVASRRRPLIHTQPGPGEPTMPVHDVLQRAAVAAAIAVVSAVAPAVAQSAA